MSAMQKSVAAWCAEYQGLQVSGYAALFWRRHPLVALWSMFIAGGHLSLEAYALAVVLQGPHAPASEIFSSLILR